jgi:hypothetical protein
MDISWLNLFSEIIVSGCARYNEGDTEPVGCHPRIRRRKEGKRCIHDYAKESCMELLSANRNQVEEEMVASDCPENGTNDR